MSNKRAPQQTWFEGVLLGVGLLVGLGGVGCQGLVESGPAGPENSDDRPGKADDGTQTKLACELGLPQVGYGDVRRLSALEYRNTVAALVGSPGFNPDIAGTEEVFVTELGVRSFEDAASEASGVIDWAMASPCPVGATHDAACAKDFIATFGRRAFRRPLLDEERTWLEGVYTDAAAEFSFKESLEIVVRVMLQAPQFLYLHEEGIDDPALPYGIKRLTGYERASRLSYFLWNTMPDTELLDAAESGALDTPEGVRAQAERMVDDPRNAEVLHRFVSTWMDLDGLNFRPPLEGVKKDASKYPAMADAALRAAMRGEIEALVDRVFREGDANLASLLTSTDAYVTPALAAVYGVTYPESAGGATWVALDGEERAGLFTRAAFLTTYASDTVASPILRGVYMLENVFCTPPGPPPANVNNIPVEQQSDAENLSVRELSEARTSGECQGCHKTINQLGFALEHYGAIGEFQTTDPLNGEAIRSDAEILGSDVAGTVADGVEFSERISESGQVARCVASKWLATALERGTDSLDDCARSRIEDAFAEDGDLRALLANIVSSDLFLYRNEIAPTEEP
ncbi:MAG: DUF1592 domain-containing protein [Polyangiales bacterium]